MEKDPLPMHMELTSIDSRRRVMASGSILNPSKTEVLQAQLRWREQEQRREIKHAALEAEGIRLADFPGPRQVPTI